MRWTHLQAVPEIQRRSDLHLQCLLPQGQGLGPGGMSIDRHNPRRSTQHSSERGGGRCDTGGWGGSRLRAGKWPSDRGDGMGRRFHFSSIIMLRVVTSSTRHTSKTEATARSSTSRGSFPAAAPPLPPVDTRGKILSAASYWWGTGCCAGGRCPSFDRHHSHGGVARASGGRQLQIIVADGAAIVTAISE